MPTRCVLSAQLRPARNTGLPALPCVAPAHRPPSATPSLQARGHDPKLVLPGSAASVPRTCATPEDISMDCSKVERELGLKLTPLAQALQQVFASE